MQFVKGDNPSAGAVVGQFCQLTFGGVGMGIVFGIAAVWWLRIVFNDERIEIVITLISCYLTFHVCENELHASGVLGVVFLGLYISKNKCAISPNIEESMEAFWEVLSYIMNTLIFIFGGIIIVLGVFEDENQDGIDNTGTVDVGWNILLYIILHITRGITILILWWFLKHLGYGVTWKDGIVLTFAGLRGVIAIAMALIVKLEPIDSEDTNKFKDLVMFHTCGIVFFTLAINGSTMKYIVQFLGLNKPSEQAQIILSDAMEHLRNATKKEIEAMKGNQHYAGANWEQVIKALPSYAHLVGKTDKRKKDKSQDPCCPCLSKCCKKNERSGGKKQHSASETYVELGLKDRPEFNASKSNAQAMRGRYNESKYLSKRFGIDKHTLRTKDIEDCEDMERVFSGGPYENNNKSTSPFQPLQNKGTGKNNIDKIQEEDEPDDDLSTDEDAVGELSPFTKRQPIKSQSQKPLIAGEQTRNINMMTAVPSEEKIEIGVSMDVVENGDNEAGDDKPPAIFSMTPLQRSMDVGSLQTPKQTRIETTDEIETESDEFNDENSINLDENDENGFHYTGDYDPNVITPKINDKSNTAPTHNVKLKAGKNNYSAPLKRSEFSARFKLNQGGSLKNVLSAAGGLHVDVSSIVKSVSRQRSTIESLNSAQITTPIQLMLQKSEQILILKDECEDDMNQEICDIELIQCKKQIRHRILLVLQRSYHEAFEEGIISIDSFSILDNAISSALDDDDCHELSQLIQNCFKLNKFTTWSYSKCRNKLTQYWLFKQLSSAIEVGMVFVNTFHELTAKIECIPAIAKHKLLREILEKIEGEVKYVKKDWLEYMELYPEIYSAIQTRHAVQTIIHNEASSINDLFSRGLLDEIEYHKMIHHLEETEHRLYFESFYKVTQLNNSTVDKKQTVLSIIFMTKLDHSNKDKYNDKIAELMESESLKTTKFMTKHKSIIKRNKSPSQTLRGDNGIFILVKGTAAIIINDDHYNYDEQKSNEDDDENDNESTTKNEIYLNKGAIIGGYNYLTSKPHLNTVKCRTPCEFYFLSDKVLNRLLENEYLAKVFLWKQIAVYIVLSQFHRNNTSFFAFFDETNINKMCQDATFKQFDKDNDLNLNIPNCMALLLNGTAKINDDKMVSNQRKIYHSPDILLPTSDSYKMSLGSVVLIFDHDPQQKNISPMLRRRKSAGYRGRKM